MAKSFLSRLSAIVAGKPDNGLRGTWVKFEGMEISAEIKHVFITPYLQYVWMEIRGLGMDTETLSKRLWDDYAKSGKTVPENLYFLQWGIEVLNPILNQKLNRPTDHPTFVKMMDYLMKPFIDKDPYLNKIRLNK